MKPKNLILLFVVGFFCLTEAAWSISLNESGTLELTGKLQTRGSWRTEDSEGFTSPEVDAGTLVQHRNLLYLEVNHNLEEAIRDSGWQAKYHLLGRFLYEGIYDYGPSEWQDTRDANKDEIDDFKWDADLWEGYFDLSRGPFFLRVGRQNLAWGETDVFRLLDGINPLDNTYGGIFEDLDDRRIPLYMLRSTYDIGAVGPVSSLTLEGFVAPTIGDNEDRVSPSVPPGTPYYPPLAPIESSLAAMAPPDLLPLLATINISDDTIYPDKDPSDWRWGVRIGGIIGDNLTVSLAHYKSYMDTATPRLKYSNFQTIDIPTGLPLPLPPTIPVDLPIQITTDLVYEDIQVTGASFNFYEMNLDMVFRAEVAWFWDEPVFIPAKNTPFPNIQAGDFDFNEGEITYKDFFRYAIGFDKNLWIRSLNSKKTFFLSCQYFGSWMQDYDGDIVSPLVDPDTSKNVSVKRDDHFFTGIINTEYLHGNLIPELIIAYDVRGNWMFQPSLEYKWEPFRFKLQYNTIEANSLSGFGAFGDRDQVSLSLTLLF